MSKSLRPACDSLEVSKTTRDFLERGLISTGSDTMPHSPYDRLQDEQFRASELVQGSVLSTHHGKGLGELIWQVKRSPGYSQGDTWKKGGGCGDGGGVGAGNRGRKEEQWEQPTVIVFTHVMRLPVAGIHF